MKNEFKFSGEVDLGRGLDGLTVTVKVCLFSPLSSMVLY